MEENGKECNCIIGISGGKDSSVVAGLCVEAFGKDRVIGVLMPNGIQDDIQYSKDLINHLGIKSYTINLMSTYQTLLQKINKECGFEASDDTKINLPPRLRMSTLFAVAQSMNGRVIGTANLSENYIGYCTYGGDSLSSCEPIGNITATEVKAIGRELGLQEHLIEKTPTDGLCHGLSDEEKLGFTYEVLDKYLREGKIKDMWTQAKIERMHYESRFKFSPIPMYTPDFMLD